jgi:WD40 repeat protein/serine/threonine protein kinase
MRSLVIRLEKEQSASWKCGKRDRVPVYLQRYPILESDPNTIVDLIYNEFLLREEYGEAPRWEEYFERFPHLADRLGRQRECHEAFPFPSALVPSDRTTEGARPPELTASTTLPVIPGYEILDQVGKGGMGVVYRARQSRPNRVVALKMLKDEVTADAFDLARFRAEADILARLSHPNIVQVYEVGEHHGRPWFSLEFCPGGSLAGRLGGAPMPPGEAAGLVEVLARAMHATHRAQVIHRDLKPANILLADDGTPKITDFGLAKLLDADAGQTRSGWILGTASYMAPEQAAGRMEEIGPAVDGYALGAILYELLTGRPPFRGVNLRDTLEQVECDEPVPPRRFLPSVPYDLETICLKCLAKAPAKRYGDALALAEDLRRFLRGEPIRARRTPLWERGLKWVRRQPAAAGLLLASVVATGALAGALVTLVINARLAQERQTLEQLNRDLEQARGDLEQANQKSERSDYLHRIVLVDRERADRHWRQADRLLDDCPQQLRGWEWHFLKRLCHRDLHTLDGHGGPIWSLAFSPEGQRLFLVGPNRVRAWDPATAKVEPCFSCKGSNSAVALSPDGKRIALAVEKGVLVQDILQESPLRIFTGHTGPVHTLAISPDGTHITSADEKGVKVWKIDTGEVVGSFPERHRVKRLAFSRDGESVASAGSDGMVKVWNARTGQDPVPFNARAGPVNDVAFSPDGKQVAAAHERGKVTVWDRPTRKQVLTLAGHVEPVLAVAYSPDGQLLASASRDKTIQVWDAATGKATLTLTGHTNWVHRLAFSPDGRQVASVSKDETVKIHDVTPHPETIPLEGLTDAVSSVAFAPSSRLLATVGPGGRVRIRDTSTGKEPQEPKEPQHAGVSSLAFSPDGRYLALGSSKGIVRVLDLAKGIVRVLDLATFQEKGRPTPQGSVAAVAFSPDGKQVASGWGDEVVLWDIDTGRPLCAFQGDSRPITSLAFSPDGKRIASASGGGTVKVHDVADGKEPFTLTGHLGRATRIAFSKGGQLLVSGGADGKVKIHDAATGRVVHTIGEAHTGTVSGVAFSPDNQRVVSVGGDDTVKLWDVLTGQETLRLPIPGGAGACVAFSPDGKYLAAGGLDGVRLWWR